MLERVVPALNNGYNQCEPVAFTPRSAYIYGDRKIFPILLWTKKEKAKPKDLADRLAGNLMDFCAAPIIAQPLLAIKTQKIEKEL